MSSTRAKCSSTRIIKLNPQHFDWILWRSGSPVDIFGMKLRTETINSESTHLFKKYAVGYCNGENLVCRPKKGYKAVMFLKNDEVFWFHVKNEEFILLTK